MQRYRDKVLNIRWFSLLIGVALPILFSANSYAKDFPKFPFAKDMNVVIAASSIVHNGVPTRIYQFDTEMSLADITEYYAEQWKDMDQVDAGDRRILSHREGDHLQTVQIELSEHPTTHGILVSSPVFAILEKSQAKIKKLKKAIGKDFPSLPNTVFISDIYGDEITGQSRSLLFFNEYDIERNIEFYDSKMADDGWVSIDRRDSLKNTSVLAMNKGGKKFNISFSRNGDKTHGVAVFLP